MEVPCNQWREKHHDTAATGLISHRSQLFHSTLKLSFALFLQDIVLQKAIKKHFLEREKSKLDYLRIWDVQCFLLVMGVASRQKAA